MNLVTVVGARPQFVKAAPVSRAVRDAGDMEEILVHTGQHFDRSMSEVFFEQLGIPEPAVNLGVAGGGLVDMTAQMMLGLDRVLEEAAPDALMVYGDTTSTLAGALAAFHRQIPVVHVEAGLRSFNRQMPEERNRVLTDHASTLLLCPTSQAVVNLADEGITAGVHHVGDVMLDAFVAHAAAEVDADEVLAQLGVQSRQFVLATVHRQENTDDATSLRAVIDHLRTVSQAMPVVLPLHPRARQAATRFGVSLDGLHVTDPLDYQQFAVALANAAEVHTDSGGVQKEAYFHRVPCVTLRTETEWVETISHGWNRLWTQPPDVHAQRTTIDEYGDGHAAHKIVDVLRNHL